MGRTNVTGSSPGFVVDHASLARNGGRQVDFVATSDRRRSTAFIVKANGGAIATTTSITVDALPEAVPAGTLLNFGQAEENVRVTTLAAKGATTLLVDPLPNAIEDDDEAVVGGTGSKVIKAGTIVAELSSGKIVPRKDATGGETAIGFIASDANEDSRSDALTGYGVLIGGVFYRDLLPDRNETAFDDWITEINDAGPGVRLETYSDSRAS